MRAVFRMSLFFSMLLFFILMMWFDFDHRELIGQPDDSPLKEQRAFNEQQSEDLVMTVQLFLDEVKHDLLDWEEYHHTGDAEEIDWLKEEVNDHSHIDGFASYTIPDKERKFEVGTLPDDPFEKIDVNSIQDETWVYSEPYITNGTKKILMGLDREEEAFLAEVDLSFVENFIKELASVADNNGNFFIGDTGLDVAFSKDEAELDETAVKKKIPELDWGLYMSSEQEVAEKEEVKSGEVVVVLEDDIDANEWAEEHDVYLIDETAQAIVVRDLTKTPDDMINDWSDDPAVVYMEPNYTFEKQVTKYQAEDSDTVLPNDEFYDHYQWNLKQLNLETAWEKSTGKEEVPVAIIDSGIDPEHPDLEERIVDGYNAFEDNDAFSDENGHGTHVAGIFGAITNNDHGIAGVTWSNPVLAVKVLDEDAMGSSYTIAKGVRWATDNGAKVINLSLGEDHNSDVMYEAIRYAYDHDVVLIAATGNDNVETPMYPAAYDEVLAVGSINENLERSFFSNYGNHTDVAAPGEHIPSTFLDGQYVMMSGTSMSSPHVTGIASLIRSEQPDLSNEQVYDLIRSTAFDLGPSGYDTHYGYGLINPEEALHDS